MVVIAFKMTSKIIVICALACFVQNSMSQMQLGNNCGRQANQPINFSNNCGCQPQPINLGNIGNLGNLGNLGLALSNGGNGLSLNNAATAYRNNAASGLNINNAGLSCMPIGNLPNSLNINNGGCNNAVIQSTSQQVGYGDVAIVGEMPVAGPTALSGNVPVIGYVLFEGHVPAGGMVSVVDPCGCGCNQ